MITTEQLHKLFNLLEQDISVSKPYTVVTVKRSGDAIDIMTTNNSLRVFLEEEKVIEL